jgi:hypothetical protein
MHDENGSATATILVISERQELAIPGRQRVPLIVTGLPSATDIQA